MRPIAVSLEGARVLVVEDEYFLADDLARILIAAGAEPVGPVPSLEAAEMKVNEGAIDGAILDMNLRGELAFGFAERICSKVPCVIVSGYTGDAFPPSMAHLSRLEKPVEPSAVVALLSDKIAAAGRA